MSRFIDELIEQYSNENDTVKVTLPGRDPENPIVIEFRIIKDQVETNQLKIKAADWITQQNTLASRGILQGEFKEFHVNDAELLGQVYVLGELAVDEEWRNKGSWLKLARKAGPVFSAVFATVDAASLKNRQQLMATEITHEKKDLKTPSTEQE